MIQEPLIPPHLIPMVKLAQKGKIKGALKADNQLVTGDGGGFITAWAFSLLFSYPDKHNMAQAVSKLELAYRGLNNSEKEAVDNG